MMRSKAKKAVAKPEGPSRIAVCQVSFDELDRDIRDLQGYQLALVVFRFETAIIGQAWLPVRDGCIPSMRLRESLAQFAWPAWQQVFAEQKRDLNSSASATVLVCTRSRTSDLVLGLPKLQEIVRRGHEVIIVDNDPSDDSTARLVAEYPEITYLYEPRAGLDHARNRGLMAARGEIVAFIDDDAVADGAWPEALLTDFVDPMVAVVTGITMPLELETPAQQWFEKTNSFGRGFERQEFDVGRMSVISTGRVGAGVNMAIRRSVLGEVGLFDEALDGGTLSLSGGDQEFFYRVLAHGYRIVYEPRALVWHKHRRDWDELRHTVFGYGVGLFAWWTRTLLVEKELTLLILAPLWFCQHHLKNVLLSLLKRPRSMPLDLAWAELHGALVGPYCYLRARRQVRRPASRAALQSMPPQALGQSPSHPAGELTAASAAGLPVAKPGGETP